MIEYLQHYLNSNLKVQVHSEEMWVGKLLALQAGESGCPIILDGETQVYTTYEEIKPIFRTFSQLIEPMKLTTLKLTRVNETKTEGDEQTKYVIPLIEMAKMATNLSITETKILNTGGYGVEMIYNDGKLQFDIDEKWNMSIGCTFGISCPEEMGVQNQVDIFQFLYGHHFDVHNLISQGKAIAYGC